MNSHFISWSLKPRDDTLALSRSDLHVKNPTMPTMTGRATQSTMRLMGSSTGHATVTEGLRLSSAGGFRNKNTGLKSRNTCVPLSVAFTWHLHLLSLSSFWSFVTRVTLQRLWLVRLYLHGGERPAQVYPTENAFISSTLDHQASLHTCLNQSCRGQTSYWSTTFKKCLKFVSAVCTEFGEQTFRFAAPFEITAQTTKLATKKQQQTALMKWIFGPRLIHAFVTVYNRSYFVFHSLFYVFCCV